MGDWLLRGPLEEREVNAFMTVQEIVRERKGTYEEAVTYLIEAMLQSLP